MVKRNSRFLSLLDTSKVPLLSDGAMGTVLNARGESFGQCLDALNLTKPALVEDIHRAYIEAGSQVIQTNTFGANAYKLAAHDLEDQVKEINQAGVKLAHHAVETTSEEVLIAGDVGPLGIRLAPFGRVRPEQARQVFAEQISALVEAGVDILIIETFTDLAEILEAVAAARQVCDLPVVASMTFTRDDRTLMGENPLTVAKTLAASGADLIGINCSGGPAQLWRILRQMVSAVPGGRFSVMPNAGWPEQVGGRIMYPADAGYFGEYALAFCDAGASLIGGCCGTTPLHIASMRTALDSTSDGCRPTVSELTMPVEIEEATIIKDQPSQLAKKLTQGKFVVSVEMDPPRGLSAHKLLAGASLLSESGADVINVADSPMARMRMSPWAVCEMIQRVVKIDTILHFPTRGRNLLRVQGDLLAAHALGIRNVFMVMGDPTSIGEYPDAMDDFDLVPSGLIKLVKQNFNVGIDHAGADIGQPTSFFAGCALNLDPATPMVEMKNLNRKIRAGADFILTQPIYNSGLAVDFIKNYESEYGILEIPVLVGVLPLYSSRHVSFLHNEVPGIKIPMVIQERMRLAGDKASEEGVRISIELIEQLRSWARGIYLMPQFGRYDLTAEIIEGVTK